MTCHETEMGGNIEHCAATRDVSAYERRKLQNRLHQRTWRHRRKLQRQREAQSSSQSRSGIVIFRLDQYPEQRVPSRADGRTSSIPDWCFMYSSPTKSAYALGLYRSVYEDYSLRAPRPANLPTLIRLNLLDAITQNSYYIGIPHGRLCQDENISPFNTTGPRRSDDPFTFSCPKSLQPTATQLRVIHHPWIDLIPFPKVRDNVLLGMEAGTVDDDELSADLMEFGSGDADLVRRPAMIVWGEASEYSSWEVNTAFVTKWGHLLHGCPELVASSDFWRAKRGERQLMYENWEEQG